MPFWVSGTHVRVRGEQRDARGAVADPADERHRAARRGGCRSRRRRGGSPRRRPGCARDRAGRRSRARRSPPAASGCASSRAAPAATALPLPPFAARRRMRTRSSPSSSSSEREIGCRGAVVHQHELVDVAQGGARHLDRAVGGEDGDHGGDGRRARAQARLRERGARRCGGHERHDRGQSDGAEPEHGAVAAAQLDREPGERQRGRGGHRAPGEEDTAVAAGLRHRARSARSTGSRAR